MTNYEETFLVKGENKVERITENDKDLERQQKANAWREKQEQRSIEIEKEFLDVSDDELLKLYEDISIVCVEELKEETEEIKRDPGCEIQIKSSPSENNKKMRRIRDELERRSVGLSLLMEKEKDKKDKVDKIELSERARKIKDKLLENRNEHILSYAEEKSFKGELNEIEEKLKKTYGLERLTIVKILHGNEDIENLLGYEKE